MVLNLYIYLGGDTYHLLILLSILYWFGSPVGVNIAYAYTKILMHVLVLISISDLP